MGKDRGDPRDACVSDLSRGTTYCDEGEEAYWTPSKGSDASFHDVIWSDGSEELSPEPSWNEGNEESEVSFHEPRRNEGFFLGSRWSEGSIHKARWSEGSFHEASWSEGYEETSQTASFCDSDFDGALDPHHGKYGREAKIEADKGGIQEDPRSGVAYRWQSSFWRLEVGSSGEENLVVTASRCIGRYLRKQRSASPLRRPASPLLRQRDRDRGLRVGARNPRRLFSGTEEAAVLHARTVMDLVHDIASSHDYETVVASDYILQIQRRPGNQRFYNEQLFSRQIQHAVATLKQAVEKFSANTQEISASLRAFTQKLQETEFPNDVNSTDELLRAQRVDYTVLKDDLLSASRHGETLLNCIKRPGEPRIARLCPDKLINVTAVERLLVQLEETERTFDEFWTRHEGRLTQCLQLRRFETDFRELQTTLEVSLKQLSSMMEVGDSVGHVDQLLADAQDFHMLTADQLEKAEELRIIGTQLIESQHYAVDSIQPKCVELVRMKDAFQERITRRLETLHKCRDLQERIERANKWCTEGVELLACQQIERCQAPEFAEEALRELEEFMVSSDHSHLGSSRELKTMFEDVITPETKGLVQQVLKRIEDVQMMCEKRKSSLKRLATRLPRPVHAVTPEPAIPLHYSQGQSSGPPHSHPASPSMQTCPSLPRA
ncbi:Guanine nucleotide exchange factor DBS [Chionoecetes opilio]|uniref:Guanine nucleotide exchange factor DBS n=1 Tax=Chionoecetes opilio TaxID=41210 RepID=A0A8J5CK11_CHIOP|nr:Guanine nucleotide exchange factor DBS [Chionoecetes opilio]